MSRVRSKSKSRIHGSKSIFAASSLNQRHAPKIRAQGGTAGRRATTYSASVKTLPRRESTVHDIDVTKRRTRPLVKPFYQKASVIGARAARLVKRESWSASRVQAVDEVCGRRRRRKEVIHATGRAGSNVVRKLPKYTWRSLVRCKKG